MQPYTVLDDIHEIEALPETTEKEIAYKNFRREAIKPYKQMRIPQPDFVLCCNNICNCMTKWYENIARMCNIPLIMIDIPYNNTVEVSDTNVAYVRAQFDNAIHQLEELTGKKFDEKKFEDGLQARQPHRPGLAEGLRLPAVQARPLRAASTCSTTWPTWSPPAARKPLPRPSSCWTQDLEQTIKEGTSTTALPREVPRHVRGHPLLAQAAQPVQAPEGATASTSPPWCTPPPSASCTTTWTRWPAPTTRPPTPCVSSRAWIGVRASAGTTRWTACWSTTTAPASPGPAIWPRCSAASPRIWACPAPASTATRPIPGTSTRPSMRPVSRAWWRPWRPIKRRRRAMTK